MQVIRKAKTPLLLILEAVSSEEQGHGSSSLTSVLNGAHTSLKIASQYCIILRQNYRFSNTRSEDLDYHPLMKIRISPNDYTMAEWLSSSKQVINEKEEIEYNKFIILRE